MPDTFSPILALARWLITPRQLITSLFLLTFMVSAISVVQAAHETRKMYSQIQVLQKDSDQLDGEYERLLLEESAWADYNRIDQLARQELGMDSPQVDQWVVLTREDLQ